VDVPSIEAGEMEDSSPHPSTYEKLLEVVTHAVAKLNISWPWERQEAHKKSKLDERFLQPLSQHPCWGLPFFPDLHNELVYLALQCFSNILGDKENGYGMMPQV